MYLKRLKVKFPHFEIWDTSPAVLEQDRILREIFPEDDLPVYPDTYFYTRRCVEPDGDDVPIAPIALWLTALSHEPDRADSFIESDIRDRVNRTEYGCIIETDYTGTNLDIFGEGLRYWYVDNQEHDFWSYLTLLSRITHQILNSAGDDLHKVRKALFRFAYRSLGMSEHVLVEKINPLLSTYSEIYASLSGRQAVIFQDRLCRVVNRQHWNHFLFNQLMMYDPRPQYSPGQEVSGIITPPEEDEE